MSEISEKLHHNLSEPMVTSSEYLFCSTNGPKPRNIKFIIVENLRIPANVHILEAGTTECTKTELEKYK